MSDLTNNNIIDKLFSLKSAIDGYMPFSEYVVKQLRDYYRIGLTYTSNAIEGNTLTESETKVVIEDRITIGGKSLREHYEAIGHAKAYDHIYSLMDKPISEDDVLFLHKLFFQQIDSENAGRYRLLSIICMKKGYCPVIIPPIRRAEYIAAMRESNKGDLNSLRVLVLSVIYEEMKAMKRLVESLVK
jgi:Fic family protein